MPKVSNWLIFTQRQYALLILNVKQSMCLFSRRNICLLSPHLLQQNGKYTKYTLTMKSLIMVFCIYKYPFKVLKVDNVHN